MSDELTVRVTHTSHNVPKEVGTAGVKAGDLVRRVLARFKLRGEWTLRETKRVTMRGEVVLRYKGEAGRDSLRVWIKPGDNGTACEYLLTPPADQGIQAVRAMTTADGWNGRDPIHDPAERPARTQEIEMPRDDDESRRALAQAGVREMLLAGRQRRDRLRAMADQREELAMLEQEHDRLAAERDRITAELSRIEDDVRRLRNELTLAERREADDPWATILDEFREIMRPES